jgi:hypothetical protein
MISNLLARNHCITVRINSFWTRYALTILSWVRICFWHVRSILKSKKSKSWRSQRKHHFHANHKVNAIAPWHDARCHPHRMRSAIWVWVRLRWLPFTIPSSNSRLVARWQLFLSSIYSWTSRTRIFGKIEKILPKQIVLNSDLSFHCCLSYKAGETRAANRLVDDHVFWVSTVWQIPGFSRIPVRDSHFVRDVKEIQSMASTFEPQSDRVISVNAIERIMARLDLNWLLHFIWIQNLWSPIRNTTVLSNSSHFTIWMYDQQKVKKYGLIRSIWKMSSRSWM